MPLYLQNESGWIELNFVSFEDFPDAPFRFVFLDHRSWVGGGNTHYSGFERLELGKEGDAMIQHGHQWRGLSSSGSGDWECVNCGLYVNGGIHDGGPYFPGRGQTIRRCIPECLECGETLESHANRNWKWFHYHVGTLNPYPNPKPHPCSLVDFAFERDGTPIKGSAEERYELCRIIHKVAINPTPNK